MVLISFLLDFLPTEVLIVITSVWLNDYEIGVYALDVDQEWGMNVYDKLNTTAREKSKNEKTISLELVGWKGEELINNIYFKFMFCAMNNIEISLFLVRESSFKLRYHLHCKRKTDCQRFINTFPFKSESDLLAIFFLGG